MSGSFESDHLGSTLSAQETFSAGPVMIVGEGRKKEARQFGGILVQDVVLMDDGQGMTAFKCGGEPAFHRLTGIRQINVGEEGVFHPHQFEVRIGQSFDVGGLAFEGGSVRN